MTELKPCPFCGDEGQTATVLAGGIEWAQVECVNDACGARGPTPGAEAQAVVLWNLRPLESVNADLLEALRPFAGFLSKALKGHTPGWTESMGDDHVVFSWNNAILKLGDLRGACAAISLAEKSNG